MLTRVEKAYLAGFLDGDGSIYVRVKPNHTYRYGFQIAPYIVLFQSGKSRKEFEELCSLIQLGYMRERNDGILEYIIGRVESLREFLKMVKPFTILKREQIDLMLAILQKKKRIKNSQEFQELIDLIDRFRDMNYSKTRKKRVLTP